MCQELLCYSDALVSPLAYYGHNFVGMNSFVAVWSFHVLGLTLMDGTGVIRILTVCDLDVPVSDPVGDSHIEFLLTLSDKIAAAGQLHQKIVIS